MVLINPADLTPDALHMLIYADIGIGKTTFGITAPHCLMLSVEGGESALIHPALAIDPTSRIFRVTTMDDMRMAYYKITNNIDGWGEYKSIFIDSLTDLQDKALYEEMTKPRRRADPNIPTLEDRLAMTMTLKRMMMRFRDIPSKHVIVSALYRNDKSPNTPGGYSSARPIRAELTPAVYKAISAYVDIVGYMTKTQEVTQQGQPTGVTRRFMIFDDPALVYSVKSRFRLPPWMENPTFNDIVSAIMGG